MDVSLAGTAKGLNGKYLAFFHFSLIAPFDDRDALAPVNLPGGNVVASQVSDGLDRICLSVEFHLVALHGFLDGCANITDANVNASFLRSCEHRSRSFNAERYLDSCIRGILDGREKVVINRVPRHGEGAVDNPAVEMDSKVDLHNIILVQHHLVAGVWRIVSRAIVPAQSCRKCNTALDVVSLFQAQMACQVAGAVLNALCNLSDCHARLDVLLRPLPDLSVDLCALAKIADEIAIHAVKVALLFVGGTVRIII